MIAPSSQHKVLRFLRALARGEDDAAQAIERDLFLSPGRAAGRVTAWSIRRTVQRLLTDGRRRFRFGLPGEAATLHETALLTLLEDLSAGRDAHARLRAEWLVPTHKATSLLQTAQPAAVALAA